MRGAELEPLGVALQIPDALRQRAIWHVARLPDGELALGFEGGVAVGFPGGSWRMLATPSGQTVQVVAAGHGTLLAAGAGICAIADGAALRPVAGMSADYASAEPVPEGWLVAGSDGVYRVTPDARVEQVYRLPAGARRDRIRLCRIGGDLVVSVRKEAARVWRDGRLVTDPSLAGFGDSQLYWSDGDLVVGTRGVMDRFGSKVLSADPLQSFVKEGGIVGIGQSGPLVLVATFRGGLSAYERGTSVRRWTWTAPGDIYALVREGDGFLVASSTGLYALSDPAKVRRWALPNPPRLELVANGEGEMEVVSPAGVIRLRENDADAFPLVWPNRNGASVRDFTLHFGEVSTELRTRFVTGLAVAAGVAAVGLTEELVLLSTDGKARKVPLDGIVGAVATDGEKFLAATMNQGVQVVTPDGRILDRLGRGRANVSEIRPGKVALLYWDGTILDSDANFLGRITDGNPRDAALVQGRLAVLVTRPDREPVVGWLAQGEWRPLDVPGLAEIGAEQIAATERHLFVAGPRGIVRIQLPVTAAAPPPPLWRWSTPPVNSEVTLAAAEQAAVRVTFSPEALAPAAATYLRVRLGSGRWSEMVPGRPQELPVAWGRTAVVLQAERRGLVTEKMLTIVRPFPWWLRWWIWPAYAALLVGMGFGVIGWRTRQLKRRTLELRKRVEERTAELRKANAVKEEFLASISHEIRNPLNGVVGICEMLGESEVGPRERRLVLTLGGCADQLRSMLDDILEFSHLERQVPVLSNSDFELLALVEQCARVMDPELTACSLLVPDQPCWLHGDSGKIRQVLCNLISNALKYGDPREAGIEVGLTPEEGGRTRVRLAVRNTGQTIPPEEIPLLFESFRRGTHTAGAPGSGLGLAVCRRLATALGGHLTAASAEGVTEFALEVVLASAQPPAPLEGVPTAVSRALAIEDEEYNRIVLGHVLRSLGYSIDWAVDAAGALRLAATHPYDLVLSDWRLPDMDGGELCRRLLAVMAEPKPPIIAVTAYANGEKLAEARAAGMSGFVTKPVTREKLVRAIRVLATGRQPRRSLDAETVEAQPEKSPLASLGALAPSPAKLATDIASKGRTLATLAELEDPRTGREAHGLRSLLQLAGAEAAAEQVGLLERAADAGDWTVVRQLLPQVNEDIAASEMRLRG